MLLEEILFSMNQKYSSILNNPNDHYLQIAYTQIDRNSNQEPIFTLHKFNVDNKKYTPPFAEKTPTIFFTFLRVSGILNLLLTA